MTISISDRILPLRSKSVSGFASRLIELSPPTISAAAQGSDEALIQFTQLTPGCDSYTIEQSTNASSGFTEIATGEDGSNYTATSLSTGTTYYFRSKAVASGMDDSVYSAVVSVAIGAFLFTPMVAENYNDLALDTELTQWRSDTFVSDAITPPNGTKCARMLTVPGFLPPSCGGMHGFGGRRVFPQQITEGYTFWQRMYMYFPSAFSFGYLYGVRDTTTMAATAAQNDTSIQVVPPQSVALYDGSPIRITCDDGTRHFTYVNGGADIVGGQVNLLDPMPATATAGNYVATHDKAEALFCGKEADQGLSGIKWFCAEPNVGRSVLYTKIGNSKRQIDQGDNILYNYESEVSGSGNAGSDYRIPRDTWIAFQWAVKVGTNNTGAVRMWIDNQLKVESLNINTLSASAGATALKTWGLGDYWNGVPYTDGQPGRDTFYIAEIVVATDMPGYGAPLDLDPNGNTYIAPTTFVPNV